jgi:sugar fermentation stimulation protein A
MRFSKPHHKATLVKRYKRFLADVVLEDGTELTVHCANSGAMTACKEPGRPIIISDSQNPKRKLQYTWEMIQMGRTWVGVNTANPNQAVAEFIEGGHIPELTGYETLKREVKYGREGKSRIDILLTRGEEKCYVEIKSATMRVDEHAAFPDAVTTRGQKHIEELEDVAQKGQRAVLFFFVGRNDCERFRPADEVDKVYGQLLRRAVNNGVEILAYQMKFTPTKIEVIKKLPVDLQFLKATPLN